MIAALGRNRELGRDGRLLWHIPGDLPRFKALTMGYPILMGRKTHESIGRVLPGRTNIVMTLNDSLRIDGAETVSDLAGALNLAHAECAERLFVIGGAQIYRLYLPVADRLELTLVDKAAPDADVFFPDYADLDFVETFRESHSAEDMRYDFVTLERKG